MYGSEQITFDFEQYSKLLLIILFCFSMNYVFGKSLGMKSINNQFFRSNDQEQFENRLSDPKQEQGLFCDKYYWSGDWFGLRIIDCLMGSKSVPVR